MLFSAHIIRMFVHIAETFTQAWDNYSKGAREEQVYAKTHRNEMFMFKSSSLQQNRLFTKEEQTSSNSETLQIHPGLVSTAAEDSSSDKRSPNQKSWLPWQLEKRECSTEGGGTSLHKPAPLAGLNLPGLSQSVNHRLRKWTQLPLVLWYPADLG